jgi:hypothetical protein
MLYGHLCLPQPGYVVTRLDGSRTTVRHAETYYPEPHAFRVMIETFDRIVIAEEPRGHWRELESHRVPTLHPEGEYGG